MKWATSLTSVDQNIESQVKNLQEQGKTVVAAVSNNQLIGLVAIADQLRHESKDVLNKLNALKVKHMVMLTGDAEHCASHCYFIKDDRCARWLVTRRKIKGD